MRSRSCCKSQPGYLLASQRSLFRFFSSSNASLYPIESYRTDFPQLMKALDALASDVQELNEKPMDKEQILLVFTCAMILNFQRYQAKEKSNRQQRRKALEEGNIQEYERIVLEPFMSMDQEFNTDLQHVMELVKISPEKFQESFEKIRAQDPGIVNVLGQIWQSIPQTTVENPVFNRRNLTDKQIIEIYDGMTDIIKNFKFQCSTPEAGMVVKSLYANDMASKQFGYEHEDLLLNPKTMTPEVKLAFERCYEAMKANDPTK